MRDLTEIGLALISLATVGLLIVNARGTATVADSFGRLISVASFQGAGTGYGTGF